MIALKVLIICLAFAYIYVRFSRNESLSPREFVEILSNKPWWPIPLFFALATLNWIVEILKWQHLASSLDRLSFGQAAKQSLASHTVSLATPNRIGEYGAKAFFFEKKKRKRVLLLNLYANLNQMLVTLAFGIVGLIILIQRKTLSLSLTKILLLLGITVIMVILGYAFKERELVLKGLTFSNVSRYYKGLSTSLKVKVFIFSIIRYLTFSTLFYVLLKYFNAPLELTTAYPLLFVMYLFVSVIPSFLLVDVIIRGGVALWLFAHVGVNEITVACAVMTSWLLNFVFPALCGSPYVITQKAP
ncbi:MAG: flippase-like domain-containing protein [Flavobacteriaceae bacterium]|nr:flippase-like domain-containing protein [Flavobacteriaceae bacterium]